MRPRRRAAAASVLAGLVGLAGLTHAQTVGFSTQPVPGGFDVFVHADAQIEAVILGIRTDAACASGCTFVFDDAHASAAAGHAVVLENLGSFARSPIPGFTDYFIVQGVNDADFPLNTPVEAADFASGWRLGKLFTSEQVTAPFVGLVELDAAAGSAVVFAFDGDPGLAGLPVDFGEPANRYLTQPVPEPTAAFGLAAALAALRRRRAASALSESLPPGPRSPG